MPTHSLPIVGAHFRPPAKAILQVLPLGCPLLIRPEPTNPYDANALQVLVETSSIPHTLGEELDLRAKGFGFSSEEIFAQSEWHLGYIPRGDAAELAGKIPPDLQGSFALDATGKPLVSFPL